MTMKNTFVMAAAMNAATGNVSPMMMKNLGTLGR